MKRFVLLLALFVLFPAPGTVRAEPFPPVSDCQEDEECWDCSTMGNKTCGLIEDGALWLCAYVLPGAPICATGDPDRPAGEPYRHICPEVFTDYQCEVLYETPVPVPVPTEARFTG